MTLSICRAVGRLSASVVVAAVALSGITAWAQDKDSKMQNQLVGTYSLVSVEITHADGKKSHPFGPTPKGMATFTANGRFMVINTNPATPKFGSKSRTNGTAEENKAAVIGSLALFGTYKVIDKDIIFNIEASSYPNWNGAEQKRPINSLTADGLAWTNPAPSTGAPTGLLVWKRIN